MEPPRFLYRRFPKREWAEQFANGHVWLSTYESLRHPHHPRSDLEEGQAVWHQRGIDSSDRSQHESGLFAELERAGVLKIRGDVTNITIGEVHHTAVANGFLLCASIVPTLAAQFGEHCVRIRHPDRFAGRVAAALNAQYGVQVELAHQELSYARATGARRPLNPFFAGSPGNQGEREYRFAWRPLSAVKLEPMLLRVSSIAGLCDIMDATHGRS